MCLELPAIREVYTDRNHRGHALVPQPSLRCHGLDQAVGAPWQSPRDTRNKIGNEIYGLIVIFSGGFCTRSAAVESMDLAWGQSQMIETRNGQFVSSAECSGKKVEAVTPHRSCIS